MKQLPARARLKEERGQAAIFMALFVSTMILLFAFTTNVGMLVHAKINLQNAADAAAYSGAAVQARQLTAVSYLNWEMRRALKEFLFYYTVRGQYLSMPCYPLTSEGQRLGMCPQRPGNERYAFNFEDPREGNNETGGPFLPSTCIIFDKLNNYCQKAGVPGIPEFPAGGGFGLGDPIVAAVRSATNQIIQKKIADCEGRTDINRKFLIAWLFNLSPVEGTNLLDFSVGLDRDDPFPFTNGLERLGVLPRMAILRARIDNFEEVLNMNLATEGVGLVSDATIQDIRSRMQLGTAKAAQGYFERPIQAYLSARNNLPTIEEANGNFTNIELTELLPDTAPMAPTENLRNPPVLAKFNDLITQVSFANSVFRQTAIGDRGNCYQFREIRTINRFPYGVTKDPSVLTYYAVRLKAQARLLFSPFGGNGMVNLSAYAAAKPFGSRVGKNLNPSGDSDGALRVMSARALLGRRFQSSGGGSIDDSLTIITGLSPRFPNPLVEDRGGQTAESAGFSTNAHLGYLVQAMDTLGGLQYGPRLAGAYAPWEVGFYSPPASYDGNQIIGKFEDNPIYAGKYFEMAASVMPVNQDVGNDLSFLRNRVMQYFLTNDQIASGTLNDPNFAAFLDAVLSDRGWALLLSYMNDPSYNQVNKLFIPDPMLGDVPLLQGFAQAAGQRFTVAGNPNNPYKRQLTSWNNQKTALDTPADGIEPNSELGLDIGRSGYSVKFVSFGALKGGGRSSNDPELGGAEWSNPFDRFNGGGDAARITDDINQLKH